MSYWEIAREACQDQHWVVPIQTDGNILYSLYLCFQELKRSRQYDSHGDRAVDYQKNTDRASCDQIDANSSQTLRYDLDDDL